MFLNLPLSQKSAIVFIFFLGAAVFVPIGKFDAGILTLLSVATFLFGILGAFIMQNRHNRLTGLRKYLRSNDGVYYTMYKLSSVFGKQVQKTMQKKIDAYFVMQIDYDLQDIYKVDKEFEEIYDYVLNLRPKGDRQLNAYGELIDMTTSASINRKMIEYLVRNRMLKFKWVVLIGLLAVILISIFTINDGSALMVIVTVLLATSVTIFLLMMHELDSLRWKEQGWIWDPLEQFFIELGVLPYYTQDLAVLRRLKFSKGVKRRIAYFPNPYPNFKGKKVKIKQY